MIHHVGSFFMVWTSESEPGLAIGQVDSHFSQKVPQVQQKIQDQAKRKLYCEPADEKQETKNVQTKINE